MSNAINDGVRAPRLRKVAGGAAAVLLLSSAVAATVGADAVSNVARPEGIVAASRAEVFISLSPTRVMDTRGAASGGPVGGPEGKLQPNSTRDLMFTAPLVPAEATAVVLNTTIDLDATDRSFISIYPKGEQRSSASANNALPGFEVSNLTIARLGADNGISIYNLKGELHLVLDIVGYLLPISEVNDIPTTNQPLATISTFGTSAGPGQILPALGAAISFDVANDVTAGDDSIARAAGTSAGFELAAGTYRVDYRVAVGASPLSGEFQLALDGDDTGTALTIAAGVAVDGETVSDSVLIEVAAGGSTLTLEGSGLLNAEIGSSSIIIERIA